MTEQSVEFAKRYARTRDKRQSSDDPSDGQPARPNGRGWCQDFHLGAVMPLES